MPIALLHFVLLPPRLFPGDGGGILQGQVVAAELGDSERQYLLGRSYRFGTGVMVDTNKAVEWYGMAAAKGHTKAQLELGLMYYEGREIPRNPQEAYVLLSRQSRNAQAQLALCDMLLTGEGVAKSEKEAFEKCNAAAAMDYLPALHQTAVLHMNGLGTKPDTAAAGALMMRAALRQDKESRLFITEQDTKCRTLKGRKMAEACLFMAGTGDPLAQFQAGNLYYSGSYVQKSPEKAAEWYKRAAMQGMASAQFTLGNMKALGDGVAVSLPEAYAWYAVAYKVRTGLRDPEGLAQALQAVESQLQATGQMGYAHSLATEYMQKYVPGAKPAPAAP